MSTTEVPPPPPAFFDGQRLTAADLEAARASAEAHRRLHNRALHGVGVVEGYEVTGARGARSVGVTPGYALDNAGREIVLAHRIEVPVPPVLGPTEYGLVVSHLRDERLEREERAGECGTRGAVRLVDAPGIDFHDLAGPAVEGVLIAVVAVAGCKIASLSLGGRQELREAGPYLAAGATPAGTTAWRRWPDAAPIGVATTVSTASGAFATTPRYQARVGGDRVIGWNGAQVAIDGHAHVAATTARSFELRVILPLAEKYGPPTGALRGNVSLNPTDVLEGDLLEVLSALGWHVVWMGIEG